MNDFKNSIEQFIRDNKLDKEEYKIILKKDEIIIDCVFFGPTFKDAPSEKKGFLSSFQSKPQILDKYEKIGSNDHLKISISSLIDQLNSKKSSLKCERNVLFYKGECYGFEVFLEQNKIYFNAKYFWESRDKEYDTRHLTQWIMEEVDANGGYEIDGDLLEVIQDTKHHHILKAVRKQMRIPKMNYKCEYSPKLDVLVKHIFSYNETIESEKDIVQKEVDSVSIQYDTDKNGKLDIIETNGFSDLLKKYQKEIVEIDKSYIQKFVKLSSFLKNKSDELSNSYSVLLKSENQLAYSDSKEIFDLQYQAFTTILMHSYNMILSVIKGELIEFYESYEVFDQLQIFDRKYEKTMLSKLDDLIESNISLEKNIIEGFSNVELSIDRMNASLTNELKGINNKLWWNNAFQMIQIYQNRKTNKLLSKK